MTKGGPLALALFLLALTSGNLVGIDLPESTRTLPVNPDSITVTVDTTRLRAVFADFTRAARVDTPFVHLVVFGRADTLIGYQVDSDHLAGTGWGFIGPVPVRVWLTADGRVLDFDVLQNLETPVYLRLALGGDLKPRLFAYQSDQQVDAITLATSTSKAIIKGVTGIVDRVHAALLTPKQ